MDSEALMAVVEGMLFCSDKPVSIARIVEVLEEVHVDEDEIKGVIEKIRLRYDSPQFGFELREAQGGFHFGTKSAYAEWVRKFLATKPFRLGRSTLETLSIIAYRQPITRAEIDQVRGIDSSHLLRTLIERGLVKMAGKAEVPGRPVQYATTPKFLEVVGLPSLAELPPLSELDQLKGDTEDPVKALEEGLERFMADTDRATAGHLEAEKGGLEEIETMLDKVGDVKREIYSSPLHADVGGANEEAAKSMERMRRPRKAVEETSFQTAPDILPLVENIEEPVIPLPDPVVN